MNNNTLKFIAAAGILAIWGGLVAAGLTPVSDYVNSLRDILVGLGVFHVTMINPKG